MYYKQETGKSGEEIASNYLEEQDYKILERNFSCNQGEIDIIAKDKEEIVFIEVKTRTNKKYGEGSEAVNINKQKHLLRAIKYYIYIKKYENNFIRIDVIEIYIKNKEVKINHIKQAIEWKKLYKKGQKNS